MPPDPEPVALALVVAALVPVALASVVLGALSLVLASLVDAAVVEPLSPAHALTHEQSATRTALAAQEGGNWRELELQTAGPGVGMR